MYLKIKKLSNKGITPTRNNESDAGLDLYAASDVFIPQGATALIPTDISIDIPHGLVGEIKDRSSLATKGLRTGAGVVDSGYTGQVGVVLHNLNNASYLKKDPVLFKEEAGYLIKAGDRIAQLVVYRVELPTVEEVTELNQTRRGSNGFGSSGI
jgi:dUTP pyrophosphatase